MDDPVETLIAAFDRANLVGLGDRHWVRADSQFRLRLIRHPSFARKVNDIVIEFGNPRYQAALDRFASGGDVQRAKLQLVWQETTQPGAWDSPVYEEFLVAVRSINIALPPDRRIRILAADFPIDWKTSVAHNLDERDRTAVAIIQQEVLRKNRKALVVFGSAHLYRNRPGTIVELLKSDAEARWFVAVPAGGPELPAAITAHRATPNRPILLNLKNREYGDIAAVDVFERGTKRIKMLNGKPVLVGGKPVFIPVFEPDIKIAELADACLYFGETPPDFAEPPRTLYLNTDYGREMQRRRNLVMSLR